MNFFFDRSIGTRIPKALQLLRLPVGIEYHQRPFASALPDDKWLPVVGANRWIVIGQDYKYHLLPNELYALKQHSIGCFYLWGAEAPMWETMRVFARAYDRMVSAAGSTPRPFVYRVHRNGNLSSLALP